MTPFFTTPRSLNKAFVFLLSLGLSLGAQAKFRSQADRDIVKDVLKTFKTECTLRATVDNDIIRRLEIELSEARRLGIDEVLKCFEVSFSQIAGVGALYQKICNDVSSDPEKISDNLMAKQFLDISKYQSGIRSYHSTLNDCLFSLSDRKGRPYIVALAGSELNVGELQRQLDGVKVRDPFPATAEPHR